MKTKKIILSIILAGLFIYLIFVIKNAIQIYDASTLTPKEFLEKYKD